MWPEPLDALLNVPEAVWDKISDTCTNEYFQCRITFTMMKDPAVNASTGHTYEHAAILKWIDMHGNDPLDRDHTCEINIHGGGVGGGGGREITR